MRLKLSLLSWPEHHTPKGSALNRPGKENSSAASRRAESIFSSLASCVKYGLRWNKGFLTWASVLAVKQARCSLAYIEKGLISANLFLIAVLWCWSKHGINALSSFSSAAAVAPQSGRNVRESPEKSSVLSWLAHCHLQTGESVECYGSPNTYVRSCRSTTHEVDVLQTADENN